MLALISCSVYLRISYMVKMSYMLFGLIIFNIMFYNVFNKIFTIYDAYNQWEYNYFAHLFHSKTLYVNIWQNFS